MERISEEVENSASEENVSFFDELENLKSGKEDAKIFAEMFLDRDFKNQFVGLANKEDFNRAFSLILVKFKRTYEKNFLADLKKNINDVRYGCTSRLSGRGNCVSFGGLKIVFREEILL